MLCPSGSSLHHWGVYSIRGGSCEKQAVGQALALMRRPSTGMGERHLTHTGRTRTVFPRPRAVMLTSADLQPQQLFHLSPPKHHSPKLPSSLPEHHPNPTDFNPGTGIHWSDFSKSQRPVSLLEGVGLSRNELLPGFLKAEWVDWIWGRREFWVGQDWMWVWMHNYALLSFLLLVSC